MTADQDQRLPAVTDAEAGSVVGRFDTQHTGDQQRRTRPVVVTAPEDGGATS